MESALLKCNRVLARSSCDQCFSRTWYQEKPICYLRKVFSKNGILWVQGKGKLKWSRHLVIWSRNHEYSVLSRKVLWFYYQSLDSEFRYALGKVLGTQDCLTLRLASHHCVLCLNPIKNHLNPCILDSHTHTNMHLENNMASLTLNTNLSIYPNKREPNI